MPAEQHHLVSPSSRYGLPGIGFGSVANSLLVIFPLLWIYNLGLLLTQSRNGVDHLSPLLFELVEHDRYQYLLLHLGVFVLFVCLGIAWWVRGTLRLHVAPMVMESVIYALTLGTLIIFVMENLLGMDFVALAAGSGATQHRSVFDTAIVSMGAGVHEELIFRLLIMGGLGATLSWFGIHRTVAWLFAGVASAAAFSAAHHLGTTGEAFHMQAFVYRFIAGLVFALLFARRSLAHAVYTHFFYDFYVLVMRS